MAVGNADVLSSLAQVKSNVDSGMFRALQDAAIRALSADPGWLLARNGVYQERLAAIVAGLSAVGLQASRPRATLYAWARVGSGWDSERFALALLERTGVSVSPGSFFGPAGEGYVRVSATAPTARIREAMERLRRFATSPGRSLP
jgi:LL-diaminopimelate aminotransferase